LERGDLTRLALKSAVKPAHFKSQQQSRDQLCSPFHAKLNEDVAQMKFDGLLCNHQAQTNLSVGQTFDTTQRHLGLAAAQVSISATRWITRSNERSLAAIPFP